MKRQAWSLANLRRPKRLFKTATTPVRAPVAPTKALTKSGKTSDEAESSAKSSDDHGLFDPAAKLTSLSKFRDTNFQRKLSYQQSLVILEDRVTPEVDALSAPKLDQQLVNQVPFKMKKVCSRKGQGNV